MKIGIIGTGVFSASIAHVLSSNTDNKIIMWSENEKIVSDYKRTNKITSLFRDIVFPNNVTLTNDLEESIKEIDVLFLMTSISYIEEICKSLKEILEKTVPICIGTKGTTKEKAKFAYEIVKQYLKNPLSILSGPTFANDCMALDPIAFNIAYKKRNTKDLLKRAFDVSNVKIIYTKDLIGTSICGCVKNIYAIGSGIIEGLGYKESTKAFYLTSVFKELETILYTYESSITTLHSLAGFGDLILTCSSPKSRNYTLGVLLGKKSGKTEIEKYQKENTLEGLSSLENFLPILQKKHIKTPILNTLYKIVFDNVNPNELLNVINESN